MNKLNISDLKANQREITLKKVKVVELSPVREFQRMGEPGRVCNATIKDKSGSTSLTLWNDEIDKVKEGDHLDIEKAAVKEWQGYLQVNIGRTGRFKVHKK